MNHLGVVTAKGLRVLLIVSLLLVVVSPERPEARGLRVPAGTLLWQDELGEGGDGARSVATSAERIFVGGVGRDSGLVRSYHQITGTVAWEDAFNPTVGNNEVLATAISGNLLYTAGQISTGDTPFWNVRAYHAESGQLLWQDQLNSDGFAAVANAVAVGTDRVYVAGGVVLPPDGDSAAWLVRAYDGLSGAVLWQDQLHVPGMTLEGRAIAVRGNTVFVAGGSFAVTPGRSWVVRAYRASDGQLLWEDISGGAGENLAKAIAVGDRGIFVAGKLESDLGLVRAYDQDTGAVTWEDRFVANADGAMGIVTDGDRVFAAGGGSRGSLTTWIVRAYTSQDGSVIWQDELVFGPSGGSGAQAITRHGDRIFVAGCGEVRTPGTCGDGLVRSYSRDGALVWEDIFTFSDDSSDNTPRSIAVRNDRLFVAGAALLPSLRGFEWFVRAYQAR
jgi:hypothetical protein